ncbi:zinc-finger domain-containing protein [Benzoatithermus flavus]|uniref:Zinc-finger domain-containing protein n=1 Tax=Benzoatithermus flavus TaxID=3108223 RepID=A0ABU8XVH9_9PROT
MASEEVLLVDDREVIITDAMHVRCDGGNGPLGHPVEYMTLEKEGSVVCKYCGRRYVHVSCPDAEALRGQAQARAA